MSGMSDDVLKEIREAFFAFATDNNDYVTTQQLGGVMRTLAQSLTEAEVYSLAREYCSHRGLVYFNEFLQMMTRRFEEQNSLASLQQAFRIFDRNDMDYFTIVEIKAVMTNLGEKITDEELHDMFKDIDTDNDGKVTFSEFVAAMRSN